MKLLAMWCWSNKDAKEVTERFKKWEGKGDYKVLYSISTMISQNRAFMVAETINIAEIQKDVAKWTGLCTFEFIMIMDSRKAVAVSE